MWPCELHVNIVQNPHTILTAKQVYCAECFENRRPTKAQRRGAGFPTADGSTPTGNSDLRCAVEGCETKVVPKGEWVGIFL
jgi:hypothetical protein